MQFSFERKALGPLHPNEVLNSKRLGAAEPHDRGQGNFADNPGPLNHLPLQDATNKYIGIPGLHSHNYLDRFPQNAMAVRRMTLKPEINRELDANTNNYNPRKYPDPGQSVTCFPARKLPPPSLNGSVCALNSTIPRGLPFSGTNDVGFVVSRF